MEIHGYANQCLDHAKQLVNHLDQIGEMPWMSDFEGQFDPNKVSATMDFLVTPEGKVLFLEAGPPFGSCAHSCAFIDREISVIALALAPGVVLR